MIGWFLTDSGGYLRANWNSSWNRALWIGQHVSEVRVSILCLIMVNFYFIQRLCLRKGLSLNKLSSRFWIVNHKTTRYILITRRSYHHLLQYYCYIRDRAKLLPDRIGISCVGSATKSSLFSGYIINHLLAKLVRSRWLHTCPFFFYPCNWPWLRLGP